MTKEALQQKLDGLIAQQECGMNLYFILHQQDDYILKKANVKKEALAPIRNVLRDNLVRLRQMMDEPTFAVLNLSGAEDRINHSFSAILPIGEHFDGASPLSLNPDTCKMNG